MINAPTQQALLAIMVHAAMADGEKSQAERDFVRDLSLQLDEQGGAKQLAQAVQAALLGRLSAQQAAAQLQDPMHRQLAYEWATAVCHADGLCSPAETAFLQRLKTDLQLGGAEPETTAHTHALAQAAYAEEAAAPLHAPASAATVAALPSAPAAAPAPAARGAVLPPQSLQELSHHAIDQALQHARGNVSQAARQLGISRQTLYRKLAGRTH